MRACAVVTSRAARDLRALAPDAQEELAPVEVVAPLEARDERRGQFAMLSPGAGVPSAAPPD